MLKGISLTQQELKKKIIPFVKPYWAHEIDTYAGFADQNYYCPTLPELKIILDDLNLPTAQGELYDCDDFAYELKAHFSRYVRLSNEYSTPMAIGIAWARFQWINNGHLDHACNWVIDSLSSFYWIEPQNKRLYDVNQCSGRLSLLLV